MASTQSHSGVTHPYEASIIPPTPTVETSQRVGVTSVQAAAMTTATSLARFQVGPSGNYTNIPAPTYARVVS
jgi:hypothetical protein